MRGVLGPGTNRMNNFTVKKATVGFGLYLLELFLMQKMEWSSAMIIVICHEFTLLSVDVLNDLGIKTYIFDSRTDTELSLLFVT